jgi:hypothetical protein
VKVSKHAATIRVSCAAISPGNCTGSLTLRTAKTVRIARHKLVLRLGRVHYVREQRPTRRPALRRRSWHEIERRSRLLLPRRNRGLYGHAGVSPVERKLGLEESRLAV